MNTIGSRLAANKGVGPGFDTLRILLAFAVVLWHCFPLTIGSQAEAKDSPAWVLVYGIIPIFFALSGFLVTGSALRLTLGKFVWSRVLRIVPALAVDTLVMVLIVGPLVTTLPLGSYFTNPETLSYFLNIVGEIHFALPGVYTGNPLSGVVNGSLWTIPAELGCYLAISALILFRIVKDWRVVTVAAIAVFAAIAIASILPLDSFPHQHMFMRAGFKLVGFFLLGSTFFLLRDRIPYSPALAVGCAAVYPLGAVAGDASWFADPSWILLTALPFTYLMAFIGVTRLPKVPFFDRGDYSYGIYLYGFPMQQLMVFLFGAVDPFALFAISFVPIMLLAALSWHLVEKPTLKLRKAFSMAAKIDAERERERQREQASSAEAPAPSRSADAAQA